MELSEYFAPVLSWLDSYDRYPAGFNMNCFWAQDVEDYSGEICGTVYCIAGFINEYWGLNCTYIHEVAETIGMTRQEYYQLFYASEQLKEFLVNDLSSITPEQAAKTIRHFLLTRQVLWNI